MDGEDPKKEYQRRSTADYADFKPPERPKKQRRSYNWKKPLKYLLILVVLAGLGVGVYKFATKPEAETKSSNNDSGGQAPIPKSNIIATGTKHYSSSEFSLEFDYPDNWDVTDTAGSGKLTVTSPGLSITDQDGRKTDGKIVMTIRNKQQPTAEFDKGAAVAVRDSEKVAYTKPSQTQRGSTYLSFVRYFSSTGMERDFDAVYITGDNGYQTGQSAPKADFTAVDPLIRVTFLKNGTQITVADNMWDDPDYSKPIKAMLQSLIIN